MNAVAAFAKESAMPDTIRATDAVGLYRARGNRPAEVRTNRYPADRLPVFRGETFNGFIDRPDTRTVTADCAPEGYSARANDAQMQLRLMDTLRQEAWIGPEFVGIAVMAGIVHLFGEADSMHAALALRRIAAATPETVAIIDDLWIACE
jgi:hypothetical protein